MTCIMSQKKYWTDNSCPKACNGLFADVQIQEDMNASSDFNLIAGEYLKYKKNYVQNIEFNSSLDSTSFGELKSKHLKGHLDPPVGNMVQPI